MNVFIETILSFFDTKYFITMIGVMIVSCCFKAIYKLFFGR